MLVRIATECSSDDRDARPSLADVIGDLTTLYESLTKSTFVPYEDDDDDDDAADGANAMDTVGIVADSNVTEAEGDAVVPAGSAATDADASAHSEADTSAVPGTSADTMAPAEPTSASPSPAVAQRPLSMSAAPRMSISLVRSASGQRLLARDDDPAAASPSSAQPSSPVSGGGVRPLISLGPQARSSRALGTPTAQAWLITPTGLLTRLAPPPAPPLCPLLSHPCLFWPDSLAHRAVRAVEVVVAARGHRHRVAPLDRLVAALDGIGQAGRTCRRLGRQAPRGRGRERAQRPRVRGGRSDVPGAPLRDPVLRGARGGAGPPGPRPRRRRRRCRRVPGQPRCQRWRARPLRARLSRARPL